MGGSFGCPETAPPSWGTPHLTPESNPCPEISMDSILMTFAILNGNPNVMAANQAGEEAAVHSLEPPSEPNWKSYAKPNPLAIKSLPRAANIQWLDAHPSPGKPNRLPSSPSVTARIIGNVTEAIRSASRKFIPLRKLPSSEWSLSRISPNWLTPATARGWRTIFVASSTKGWSNDGKRAF